MKSEGMAVIKKKIWSEFFEKVASGEKKWELRLADFEISPGDTLILEEWNPKTKQYTGRSMQKKVGYVHRFKLDELFWSEAEVKRHGLQIISLE